MERDSNGNLRKDKRGYRRPAMPPLSEKCWNEEDLAPYLTGDYDMSQEPGEVQIMLDLASKLNDARVEWLMAETRRDSTSGGHVESYREPRHSDNRGARRGGFDVAKE